MENSKIKVLLAEDNPGGTPFWEQILSEVRDAEIEFIHIEQLSSDAKRVESKPPDIILLDLSLPGAGGLEVFNSVYNMAPNVPIIVVTRIEDPKLALQAALGGAQDCLVKSDISSFLLSRSMRYAIGRQRHLKELKAILVVDELTGLYNRRGFLILAEQQIKTADRTGESLFVAFADVDGLKSINDGMGHHCGDLALMETAHVLREAFRETDVLGHMSGDEFVALLNGRGDLDPEVLVQRFRKTLEEHNDYLGRKFKLSVSIGISLYDPRRPSSVEDLLVNADKIMYEQKRRNKAPGEALIPSGTTLG